MGQLVFGRDKILLIKHRFYSELILQKKYTQMVKDDIHKKRNI